MKKFLAIILAALMLLAVPGCFKDRGQENDPTQNPDPTADALVTDPAATDASPDVTDVPGPVDPDADAAFEKLDLEIFRELVTSSTDTYNQYISSDPARFGIDPADLTAGWGDFSYEAHVSAIERSREILASLDAIDRNSLSESNRNAYDALKRTYSVQVMYEDYFYYDEPLTPLNGMHTMLPLSMICFNIRSVQDIDNYLLLIEDMPRMLGSISDFEEEKASRGLFMCEIALDQVVESCRSFAGKGENSFLISYFEDVLNEAKRFGLTTEQEQAARSRNRDLVLNGVLPAYTNLADRLEAHRADCSAFVGAAARSEEAKAFFVLNARDEGATMDDMERVIEMLENMGSETYLDMCYALVYGGDDILEKYENNADLGLGSIEENMDWLKEFTDMYYPDMPDYSLEYVNVPSDIAEDFSPAAYLVPAFDDYYDNLMLINPSDEGSDSIYTIAHESIPGHMYQYLNARNRGSISLAQQVLEPTGYAEAWTVLTEAFVATKCFKVGINYGTMLNCESTFFNIYLPAYISIMVNYNGWSFDDVKLMLDDYGVADAADIFYEYAITMPVYAMSYALGYSYMFDIYNDAEPSTPAEYKAFFDKYLSFGPTWMDLMWENMHD